MKKKDFKINYIIIFLLYFQFHEFFFIKKIIKFILLSIIIKYKKKKIKKNTIKKINIARKISKKILEIK